MNWRLTITMSGIAVLAIFAIAGKLPVMLVSAATIGIVIYVFRGARIRDRLIAIVAAGLGGSIAAEIVMTVYRHTGTSGSVAAGESGEMFMMAILLGVINSAAVIMLISLTEIVMKFVDPQSE
jgi:hypothetical protein